MPSATQPAVSIILLNYQNATDTIACISSLRKIDYDNFNLIIVDNASADDSVAKIKEFIRSTLAENTFNHLDNDAQLFSEHSAADYTLINSGENGGFGFGNNLGIRYALEIAKSDYVLLLNNDTEVKADFLNVLVNESLNDSAIGIASCRMYYHDDPQMIWFNGGQYHRCSSKIEHYDFRQYQPADVENRESSFITGCLWLIPRAIIEKVGMLDHSYFMYVEDMEFCHRVTRHGFKLYVTDKTCIWHKVGSTSAQTSSGFSVYWMARNRIKFIRENVSGLCRWTSLIYSISYFTLRWAAHRKFNLMKKHIQGIFDGFRTV